MGYVIGAIIAFLFIKAGGFAAFGNLSSAFAPGASEAAPTPASTGAPLSSVQLTAAGQASTQENQQISSGISIVSSDLATQAATEGATGFATAIPVIGQVVGAVANVLLAQHTARLKGAIAENQLIPQSVQAFDSDIQELVTAYNAGQIPVSASNGSSSTAAGAVAQMDQSLYSFMKSNAVGPGRSWTDIQPLPSYLTSDGPPCNSACTAECCVFWQDMNNLLAEMYRYFSGQPIQTVLSQKTANGIQFTVPEVVPPPAKYGNFGRNKYVITLTIPANAT